MDKQEIRKLIAGCKRQLPVEELGRLSAATTSRLLVHPKVRAARTVLLYYSMPGEVATHDLVEELHRQGKTVLLPRVRDGESMDLVPYTGVDCLREAGAFHILEPKGEPYTHYNDIDVAVVPGVAFTRDGKRMGRGRGYYDRMLPQLAKAYKIGVCFPFQLMEDIPIDRHDVFMDEVIF